jgi:glycosyltransferase involved in cell wall biosynthesis
MDASITPSGSPGLHGEELVERTTDSRITVAMVIQNYLPTVGGAERQLNSLNPLLLAHGIVPVVYTRSRPGQPSTEILNGARVVRVRCAGPKPIQSIMYVVGTLWHLIRSKPDVVHAYDTLTPSLIAGIHRLISGTPYLTKLLRSGELGDINRLANKPLGKVRLELLKRSVDKFVAISHDLEAELDGWGVSTDRRIFIPNGVDTERFRPPTDHEHPVNRWADRKQVFADWPEAPVVVVVGRISPEKRVIELAQRWEQFVLDRPDNHWQPHSPPAPWLYVVGEGPLSPELNGLGNVRFLGKREDVAEILRWSDVYVSTSSAEGLSNALLEAMASGCPCVVTDVGGVGDVMTDGVDGHIVDPEGPDRSAHDVIDDIITRIGDLLDNPDQGYELGLAAREAVLRRYSLTSTASALAHQYTSLASRPTAASRAGG